MHVSMQMVDILARIFMIFDRSDISGIGDKKSIDVHEAVCLRTRGGTR